MVQYTDDITPRKHDIPTGKSDTPTGIPEDISRYTVPEAAQALGISPEAVRNRLSRGTLKSVKENGTVYVLLGDDMVRSTGDTPSDRSRHTTDTPHDISSEITVLTSAKDETFRVLKDQFEAEREANRENRRIIAGLVQRVPELEPGKEPSLEPRESFVTATGTPGNGAVPQEEEPRSWLRRFFGL